MSIDWFTVAAQVLNFLILVWLLKRFLYKPILDAIDAREKRIADELANADAKQREAKRERDEFQQKNAELASQQQALLQKASADADAERQRLFKIVREQADALSAKRQAALQREQTNLQAELRRLSADEVFAIARKTLSDLAGVSLEQSMTETFLKRLRAMDDGVKSDFSTALFANDSDTSSDNAVSGQKSAVVLRSAFDLNREQKAAIQNAVNELFAADIPLQFETAAKVISGIELSAKGQKIAWSIDSYLAALDKELGELLLSFSKSESSATASKAPVDISNSSTTPAPASEGAMTPDK